MISVCYLTLLIAAVRTLHASPVLFGKLAGILTVVSEIIAYIRL